VLVLLEMKRRRLEEEAAYVIVIDTETTGLAPRNIDPQYFNNFDNARMVEIAWQKFTQEGVFHSEGSYIIKPSGFTIPAIAASIHGISTEQALLQGIPLEDVWGHLNEALTDVKTIVAHNIQFDDSIILSEMYRCLNANVPDMEELISKWKGMYKYCTMMSGRCLTENNRWPKLVKLYEICFGELPQGIMHRATADVYACARIYFHLRNR
jgi:DNA polymerase III epsilon subunit-like protein